MFIGYSEYINLALVIWVDP